MGKKLARFALPSEVWLPFVLPFEEGREGALTTARLASLPLQAATNRARFLDRGRFPEEERVEGIFEVV